MEDIKAHLGKGGLIIAVMGILSMILAIFNYNMALLSWVDMWGNTTGWIIRLMLIVVGGALFYVFGRADDEEITE